MKKSCKGSSCIGYLEERINEIDFNSDLSRNAKFNRAIIKVNSCTVEELKVYARDLKKLKSRIQKTHRNSALQPFISTEPHISI